MAGPGDTDVGREARYDRRIRRERRARTEAEELLEVKSRKLYEANQALSRFAADLELRVQDRTRELERSREQAVLLGERDQLTGLSNRMRFGHVLDEAIVGTPREGRRVALFLIDIDDFKDINDTLGHGAGDAFLRGVANRLSGLMRECDLTARLGGDEFAAIVTSFRSLSDLEAIANRILAAASLAVAYGDELIEASCSIGIAMYPDDASNTVDLQRFADIALYKSKSLGRARWTLFDAVLKSEFEQRRVLGNELKSAIATGEIVPFFQPIVVATTGRMVGVEVLARWFHPKRGVLTPDLFIKLAEDRGLIETLFAHQLRAACCVAKRWIGQDIIRYISINVSASQFRSGVLVDIVLRTLADVGLDPGALTIEITEELLLNDLDRARAQIERLAEGGVSISLDDFGTGYSNIAYLRRLPINTLKLDRLLTVDVCDDEKARSVVKAIVEMARALDLSLVAEGIETQAQARWLAQLGCNFLQGYVYGKPMSEQAFLDEHRQASSRLLHLV